MAGTDSTRAAIAAGGPAIILVRPQMGENIGAAARAMKNFGLGDLRLVAPRDGWPNEKARAMSSRADEIVDAARVYDTTAAAVADLQTVYATTARRREMQKPVLSPRQAAAEVRRRIGDGERTGILFGGEKAGLDNDDTTMAARIIQVPANPAFSSLNLGQAVLLLAYEWFQSGPPRSEGEGEAPSSPPATAAELAFFHARLEEELDRHGFLKPPEKSPGMMRNIRNVFQRADLTGQEVRTLHGIISSLIRRDGEES
ncbi:MAG: RNA methyltransferase [Alphaproteobacteria bacterium]|nr:RNA methyltransferase [Alphaproteobacteria bacterium]MDP6564533.1 RNA methyltransferase [Alphaproteobacteria bacterium]MDP6811669.1 RNA methyltransferase [Alphaproteobacteria bacterium]